MIQDKHKMMADFFFQNLEPEIAAKYHRYLADIGLPTDSKEWREHRKLRWNTL
jgi:hypothetical protein